MKTVFAEKILKILNLLFKFINDLELYILISLKIFLIILQKWQINEVSLHCINFLNHWIDNPIIHKEAFRFFEDKWNSTVLWTRPKDGSCSTHLPYSSSGSFSCAGGKVVIDGIITISQEVYIKDQLLSLSMNFFSTWKCWEVEVNSKLFGRKV